MGYQDIINEIRGLYYDEFNMDSYRKLGSINKKINQVAINQNVNDTGNVHNYNVTKNYLEEVAFSKLKEKLGYEDEVIKKIVSYISYSEAISEIYVVDGIVLVKALSKTNDNKEYKSFIILQNGFYDIASINFNNTANFGILKKLLVDSINHIFKTNIYDTKALEINNNGDIRYKESDLNIFINCSLNKLGMINEKMNNEIIKVIIKYQNDQIFSFDMKLRDGYLVIYQNEYNVNKVSETLNNESKIKAI